MTAHSVPLSEAVGGIGESVARTFVAHAALGETVSLAEARTSKDRAKVRFLPEVVSLSEAGTTMRRIHLTFSEAPSFSEQLRGGRPYAAALSETVALSDAVVGKIGAHIGMLETVVYAEGTAGETAHNFAGNVFEAIAATASVGVSWRRRLYLNETISASEILGTAGDSALPLAETVTLSESLRGRRTFGGSLSETVTLSETRTFRQGPVAALGETVALVELLFPRRKFVLTPDESVTVAEAATARVGRRVASGEVLTIAEAVGGAGDALAPLLESLSLSEAMTSKARRFATGLAETLSLSDAVAARRSMAIGLADTAITLSDTTGSVDRSSREVEESWTTVDWDRLRSRETARSSVAESVTNAEAVAGKLVLRLEFPVVHTLANAVTTYRDANVALSESLSLSDALAFVPRQRVALSESISLSEARTSHGVFATILGEALGLTEARATHRGPISVSVGETVSLAELLGSALDAPPEVLSDTVTLVEAVAAHRTARFAGAEGFLIFERLLSRQRASQGLGETVVIGVDSIENHRLRFQALFVNLTLGQAIATGLDTAGAVAENVALSAALAAKHGYPNVLAETVTLAEARVVRFGPVRALRESVRYLETITVKKRSRSTMTETILVSEAVG